MITDSKSLADIKFQLTWKSDAATHIDSYTAQRVNFWRDYFPQQVFKKLLKRGIQEQADYSLNPGEIVPAFQLSHEYTIKSSQFDRKLDPSRIIEPRAGRFYPKGILTGMANIFRGNTQPFRCVEPMDSNIRISFNHPLASFPIDLKATILNIRTTPAKREGTCNDWLEVASTGPGMQARVGGKPTDFFSDHPFDRDDDEPDHLFYAGPRFVNHLDDQAISVITGLYAGILRPGMRILDLMSSWTSHLPEVPFAEVAGLGMNREELQANKRLNRFVVQDLNQFTLLPYESSSMDAVICTASIEYLIRPFEVSSEISRILKPGGHVVMTFSNRWFPPKAIRIWKELHEFERIGLALEYLIGTGSFENLHSFSMRGLPRPENDKYFGQQRLSDPVYAVWGQRR
ncbi:MAG: class I SAM-dependent methyltransferase [Syntrophobacteraceae bacterium]